MRSEACDGLKTCLLQSNASIEAITLNGLRHQTWIHGYSATAWREYTLWRRADHVCWELLSPCISPCIVRPGGLTCDARADICHDMHCMRGDICHGAFVAPRRQRVPGPRRAFGLSPLEGTAVGAVTGSQREALLTRLHRSNAHSYVLCPCAHARSAQQRNI